MDNWISVKDRLPKVSNFGMEDNSQISDCILLCYTISNESGYIQFYRRAGFLIKEDEKLVWSLGEPLSLDYLPDDYESSLNVTHWMPLPDYPDSL